MTKQETINAIATLGHLLEITQASELATEIKAKMQELIKGL